MSPEILMLLMIGLFMAGVLLGIPLAFIIGGLAIGMAFIFWGPASLTAMVSIAYNLTQNWVLVAVPLFIFMALMLDKSGVMGDMYSAILNWSGPLRGGLAVGTVIACTIFAACVGVAAGGVVTMTIVALPLMLKYGYDRNIAVGSILGGGTLGQLIPPSIVMVLYGVVVGESVGKLFAGGICAGVILSGLFIIYIFIRSLLNKNLCPSLPLEARVGLREKVKASRGLILPIVLVVLVLGSILSGAASPTEASAVGVVGAVVCAAIRRKLTWKNIKAVTMETTKMSGMIGWLLVAAACLAATFVAMGGTQLVEGFLLLMPGGRWGALAVVIVFLLIMGMFIDPTSMVLIAAPMFAPVMAGLGFDPLWFGLLFMVLLQIAYISPPFGWSLFFVSAASSPPVKLSDVYRSAIPFVGLQLIGLTIFIVWPQSMLWLPNLLFK